MDSMFHLETIDIIYTVMVNAATIQGASPLGWSLIDKMLGGTLVNGVRYLKQHEDLEEADAILAIERLNVLIL